jgi:N-acetylmuramoyl-L-alanine amidase
MKKRILALCFALAVLLPGRAGAAGSGVHVYVDGRLIKFSAAPITVNHTTYLPLAGLCSLMYDVRADWDDSTHTLTVSGVDLSVTATVGDVYLTANGRCLYVPDGIFRKNGLVFAPVRTVCKIFGATVTWSSAKQAVYIKSGSELIKSGSEFYDSGDLTWLSRIIQAESGGESLLGKIAVGNVVLNRVKSSSYPNTIYDVIFDHRYGVTQFTPAANGAIYNKPSAQSVLAAKLALDGADVAGDSLYFFAKSVSSGWIRTSLTFVSNIGNHNFYM